ncbi:hypothetical protein NE2007 [Nitrosomonas europaea ATCC 19718]|uniref:Uncharacterized protein n=1 Tax=Nitrosomonas europaea (strain ATCC 19718 / CIP 103999 / KCTC 2705 / NBRC 14298) TaxID=228410 RepID=Q82TA0_NITEU|nr:hypothetical protein NE2007 [Nitrosomonas europaea ATCC 19718]
MDFTIKAIALLTIGHRLHQFVMYQPCCKIAHTQLTLERQGRQTDLGLTNQINYQEPDGQRQFGALENCSGKSMRSDADRPCIEKPCVNQIL